MPTYQLAESLDQQGKEAGIMMICGAGLFVAYDALVVHTAKRVKHAQQLFVAFRHYGGFSKGSVKSSKYIVDLSLLIRDNGELKQITEANAKVFDFGEGLQECFPTSLGGIIVSYKSTSIPNIREYFQLVVAVACRILKGDLMTGYQTAGSAYGENIMSDIPDSHIIDR